VVLQDFDRTAATGESIAMGFLKRFCGITEVQAARDARPSLSSDPQQVCSILDEAEDFVLKRT
jgi:hypothetical protein